MNRVRLVVGLAILLLTSAAIARRSAVRVTPRAAADNAIRQAQQQRVAGRAEAEIDLLIRALEADPTHVAVVAELVLHPGIRPAWSKHSTRIARALAGGSAPETCARNLLWHAHAHPHDSAERQTSGARECDDFASVLLASAAEYAQVWPRIVRLWRKYPHSRALALLVYDYAGRISAWQIGLRVGAEMMAQPEPVIRTIGLALQARAARELGADSLARARENEARRLKPLGLRIEYEAFRSYRGIAVDSVASWGDRSARLLILRSVASHAYNDGDLATSERLWNQLLDTYSDLPLVRTEAVLFRGRTHLKAGRLAAAEKDLLAARVLAAEAGDPGFVIQADHNLFHVYEARGDHPRALEAGRSYIENTQGEAFATTRMMAYHDLGWYVWHMGDYERGRELLTRMLALIDSLQVERHFAGEFYERIGQLDSALYYYDLAATVERRDSRSAARRAVIAAQMGDTARAIRLAQVHDEAVGPGYPEFTPQLPGILAQLGLTQQALEAANRAVARVRARNQVAALAQLQLQRATLQLELGNMVAARALADSAVLLARRVAAFETAVLARATRALAAVTVAPAASIDSLHILVRDRALARLPGLQLEVYTLLARAYGTRSNTTAALAAYKKAARLSESIAESLEQDADRARLRSSGRDVPGQALALILRGGNPSPRLFAEWSARRKARGVAEAHETAARPSLPVPPPDAAILDYVVLAEQVAVLVVTRAGARVVVLPVRPAQLREQVRTLRDFLAPQIGPLLDLGRSHFDRALAHLLYRELVGPVRDQLIGVKRLVIIADGVLHYLPFDALVTGAPAGTGNYLLQQFTIHHAPTLSLSGPPPTPVTRSVALFTGAAVHAQAEIEAVAAAASPRLDVVRIPQHSSTERRVRALPGGGVLHFATHAALNDVQPGFAYLALQSHGHDDGRLHAFEIEPLQLRRALVVLSGCDTGRGRIAGGEGVLSLSRAFLRAGASGTVATLWPVGENAASFMATFYQQLAGGADAAEALRQAKLRVLNGSYSSPLFWAPFVLISV